MHRVGWVKKDERPNEPGKSPATHTHADRRITANDTKCDQIEKNTTNFFGDAGKCQTRRADQHRKSRSYCRTERLNCTKPVLDSQLSQNPRCKSVMPAQQGAPDGTLPPCGVRTFPPPCGIRKRPGGAFSRKAVADLFGQAMNGERKNGFPKGRECALKYAAGLRTRGERRYAIFERTVNDMPVAYRLAMEENRRLSILWFSVPFLKELFVLLLRRVSSPPGCSGNETARVRRQPL